MGFAACLLLLALASGMQQQLLLCVLRSQAAAEDMVLMLGIIGFIGITTHTCMLVAAP